MDYIEAYTRYLHAIGYQKKTIDSKITHLTTFFAHLKKQSPVLVKCTEIQAYYNYLAIEKAHCSQITISYYMVSLKQFYDWLEISNKITAHPFSTIKLKKHKPVHTRKPIPEGQIFNLWKSTLHDHEKLLLIFAYGCGLRASELQQIKLQDINFTTGILTIVKGKYNKRRCIPLQAVHLNFLRYYKTKLMLAPSDRFFKVTTCTINTYFKNMQQRIKHSPPYYTLHHLRHSIASHLVDRGVHITLVQYFLGHATRNTTQIYVTPTNSIQTWSTSNNGNSSLIKKSATLTDTT